MDVFETAKPNLPVPPQAQLPKRFSAPLRPQKSDGRTLGIVRDVLLAVLVPAIFTLAISIFQTMRPERILSTDTPAGLGLQYEDVRLRTVDSIDLAGWYVPAKSAPADDAIQTAILVLHGYPADKGDILDRVAFLTAEHSLLLIDFRHFGASAGDYSTVGVLEVEDALAGIAYLKERGATSIGIYGFSLGGAVALSALDRSGDVAAVVAEAPYATLRLIAEEPYRYLGPLKVSFAWLTTAFARVFTGIDVDAISPLAAAGRTEKPVMLIHSKADQTVPFRHSELLQGAMIGNPGAEFLFPEDLAHGEAPPEFATTVRAFFRKHLK